ncbi:MAG: archaetidylserine decarboxylase [Bermanella sp.]
MSRFISGLSQQQQLNFLLTNRIPRRLATQFMGWFSKIESRRLTRISLKLWGVFARDLNLSEARKQTFESLHDCFVRELKDGARSVDTRSHIITSPCDAIVGSCGRIHDGTVFQAKGFPYALSDLIPDERLQKKYRNGVYVTLRLTSTMYHRFHAPLDCEVKRVTYIAGDTWNVNPIALQRIEKLFCKNERAVMELKTADAANNITLVPVAAILVASIKLHCLPENLDMKYAGPNQIDCQGNFHKGQEMGYFQHGSTIIVFATDFHRLCEQIVDGKRLKMGQALLQPRQPNPS